MHTHFCFVFQAVSATSVTSYEGTSEHTNKRRLPSRVARVCPCRSHDAGTLFHCHDEVIISPSSTVVTRAYGRAARRTGDFCIVLPVHILLVLDYRTEYLGTPSRLGKGQHILVSCQSGIRLVRIHMVL